MGSKSRIATDIIPIIQGYLDANKSFDYVEPFCGGCNVIDKIDASVKYAYDKNKYLIALYQNLHRIDELPKFVSKEHYSDVRDSYNQGTDKYEDWYKGAIGFLASYNGRFFDGGYAGVVHTKTGTMRDYYDEALRNLKEQIPKLKNVIFNCCDYSQINVTDSVIYCDPPYKGTKQYGTRKNFDYDKYWDWVRDLSKNNIVICSELHAPDDFRCTWEQEIKRTIDNNKRIKSVERLFVYKENKLL